MMRTWLAALIVLAAQSAAAGEVAPRLGPLPLVAEDGTPAGSVAVGFGQRLSVIAASDGLLEVEDADGNRFRVRAGDVVRLPATGVDLRPAAGAADRPDLPLWDSALRGRGFLAGGAGGGMEPVLTLPAAGPLPGLALPVLSAQRVTTSVGSEVTLVEGLFPLQPAMLAADPAGSGGIVLHVVTDGSDYAADFTLDALDRLSRQLAAEGLLPGSPLRATRHVIHESGALRAEGEVALSGLRAEWPAADADGGPAGLSPALADAVGQVAAGIAPDDGARHVLLLLIGPGLSDDAAAQAAAQAAGDRLSQARAAGADLGGVVLLQATPEPNPANDVLLAALAGGAPTRSLAFGDDPVAALRDLAAAAPTDGGARGDVPDCGPAAAAGLPCLTAQPGGFGARIAGALAGAAGADWVAVPLWMVADQAPYLMVPPGLTGAEAAPLQDDLRLCLAAGRVWQDGACMPDAPAGDDGAEERVADLSRQIADLAAQTEAQAVALATATEDLAAARADHAAAEAALADRLARAEGDRDGLAEELAQAGRDRQSLEAQLETATAEADDLRSQAGRLAADLAARVAEHDAALLRHEEAEAKAAAALAAAQSDAEAKAAAAASRIAALESALATRQAELQAMSDAAAAADAAAQDRERSLSAELAEARAAMAETEQALAAAEDRIALLDAELAAARTAEEQAVAALADRDATLAAERAAHLAALDSAAADLDAERSARAAAEETAKTERAATLARIATLESQLAAMRSEGDDGPDLALLSAQLAEERSLREAAERTAAEAGAARDALSLRLEQAQAVEAELAALKAERAEAPDPAELSARIAEEQAGREAAEAELAALQAEAAALLARAEAADRAEDEVARLTAEVAALQAAVQEPEPAVTAVANGQGEAPAAVRPRARPVAEAAPEPARTAEAAPAPAAPEGALGILSGDAKAQRTDRRRVAPAQQAPQLNGCQFQWVGKEGRLVCP